MARLLTTALVSLTIVAAQQIGHAAENTQDSPLNTALSTDIQTGKSCMVNGALDPAICTTTQECAVRCALEGVNYAANGVKTSGQSMTLHQYLGSGSSVHTVSPRVYLLDEQGTDYNMMKLTNQEFTFTVDVSNLPCGMNGALYLSEMDASGGRSKLNPAGAAYGTGYCDAQCPKSALINGVANLDNHGACCMEMDIWEANSASTQLTPHPCNVTGLYECTGSLCGFTGVCDQDGCGYNPYGVGAHDFYGNNASHSVDTTKPLTVVTQFYTHNNTKKGVLNEIRRLYVQDGKVIQNAAFESGGVTYDSITPEYCANVDSWETAWPTLGGMPQIGTALQRGMVLIFSIWNTNSGNMSWLDTGNAGPCNVLQDSADMIEANDPSSSVTFSNIRWGDIGSTY